MVTWSTLRPLLLNQNAKVLNNAVFKRMGGGHNVMTIQPSRWQWQKFKDFAHFYTFVGVIPLALFTAYINVFIGPATLTEIPEGYEPKHWEYYRHPITRFLARHFAGGHQEHYEKYLHHLFEENEKTQLRKLEQQIKEKMAERHDYQAYYYKPITSAKYLRRLDKTSKDMDRISGD